MGTLSILGLVVLLTTLGNLLNVQISHMSWILTSLQPWLNKIKSLQSLRLSLPCVVLSIIKTGVLLCY